MSSKSIEQLEAAKIGDDEKEILRFLKEKGINQYDETAVSVELYPSEKVAGKKLESLGLVVLEEYGDTGRSFFLATLTDEGIVFVNEMLED